MKTIHVTASSEYDVKIGAGLLDTLGSEVAKICKGSTVAIISDSNVWPLYGENAKRTLLDAGFHTVHFVFPAGEGSKNGSTYLSILNFLAENQITRSDCVIALGGGVVGDITGFSAATFLRGISFFQKFGQCLRILFLQCLAVSLQARDISVKFKEHILPVFHAKLCPHGCVEPCNTG